MKKRKTYRVLGLMSGTSLDGLDMACVDLTFERSWKFRLIKAQTFRYSKHWHKILSTAHELSGAELMHHHGQYGSYLGKMCATFLSKQRIKNVDFIASHGHTIFHQPKRGFTFQLGDGAAIHATTGLPVVCDFRSLDVQLGGEGAPLVPVGDRYLFPDADVCLNLGGIANLSMEVKGKRRAFDVCFCNMALNFLAREAGKAFDNGGRMAAGGTVNEQLLLALGKAYREVRSDRRSLGREFFEEAIQPLITDANIPLADRMRTVSESIVIELEGAIPKSKQRLEILSTGGGAKNRFLIRLLKSRFQNRATIVLPAEQIIDFKEAIIFAFLGVLRMRSQINVLSSVTRSSRDSCSGVVIGKLD